MSDERGPVVDPFLAGIALLIIAIAALAWVEGRLEIERARAGLEVDR